MNLLNTRIHAVRTAAFLVVVAFLLVAPRGARADLARAGESNFVTALAPAPDGGTWLAGEHFGALYDFVGKRGANGELSLTHLPMPGKYPQEERAFAGLAVAADGNLWATEPGTNGIGRWNPVTGEFRDFPLPTAAASPDGIVAGPDGNLWFTEKGTGMVGRIDGSGKVTEFPLTVGSEPTGIAVGADGNLWVSERAGNRIARLNTAGALTEFPLPQAASAPTAIVAGPDGALWFSENGAPRIGRVQVDGTITEFTVPGTTGTSLISNGPSGDLWYSQGDSIGSIAPTGKTGEPACPSTCEVPIDALTTGPSDELAVATSLAPYPGGGGGAILHTQAGGSIGTWSPPGLAIRFGDKPHVISPGVVKVPFSCQGATAGAVCSGQLQLMQGGRRLGVRSYQLERGSGRSFSLQLNRPGKSLLSSRHHLRVQLIVTNTPGRGSKREAVLRSLRRHR